MTKHSSCQWLNNFFVGHENMIVTRFTGRLTVQGKNCAWSYVGMLVYFYHSLFSE